MNLRTQDRQVTGKTQAAQALRHLMPGKRTPHHNDPFHGGCLLFC
jgi:site-specific DNA-adenine methylase